MLKKIGLFVLVGVLLLAGCNENVNEEENSNIEIEVTTTTGQIADAVRNIGGDRIKVNALMGPGVDPHVYQATQSDISKLGDADIIFYNGLHLEGNMGDILAQIGNDKPVFAVGETIAQENLLMDPDNPVAVDPHIWFDLDLWSEVIVSIKDELIAFDSEGDEIYTENTEAYLSEIEDLRTYAEEELSKIPEEGRVLVTAHDAFTYFANAFDFEVVSIQGLSTDSDYGVRDIQAVVDILVERDVKAVFTETSVSERAMESVIEGANARGKEVIIGGSLYSDALGEEGTEEGTFIGMFKHNVDQIVSALD